MKQIFTLLLLSGTLFLTAQTTANFENFDLDSDSFLNGSDFSGGFSDGNVFLPNSYEDMFSSWSGWAISNVSENTIGGFANQYGVIVGEGAEGSETFALGYTAGGFANVILEDEAADNVVAGFYLTNSSWAYYSMQDGDDFAKKFGGATGNDPDYFLLTVKAFSNGELSTDSVDVYLADYRFEDNSQDFILDDWRYVDVTSLGAADSLQFFLSSTDNGSFGMNTPAYFCLDRLTTTDGITSVENVETPTLFEVFPNPTADFLQVKNNENLAFSYRVFNLMGQPVLQGDSTGTSRLDVRFLPRGAYAVEVETEGVKQTQMFVKN